MARLELTLAILKPHVIPNIFAHNSIRTKIQESGFKVVKSKVFRMNEDLAKDFYGEHRTKFFYRRLVEFMTSGPVEVLVLAKDNAIADWRAMLGPTKVFKSVISHPDTIRGMFGLTDTRNVGHGSDSRETSQREIEFFFPDFCSETWLRDNLPLQACGSVS